MILLAYGTDMDCYEAPYVHLKTGNVYYRIFLKNIIINATNSSDGDEMCFYRNDKGDFFVREKSEFLIKFSPMVTTE